MPGRLTRYGLAAFLVFSVIGTLAPARADDSKEYLVKAAFIYNFVKFVEWPADKAIAKQSSIDICTLGDSPMNNAGEIFKAASTAKLTLSLLEEKSLKSVISHCHILFISHSEEGRLDEILGTLKGQPVLTVSDIDDFAEAGGMIGFVMSDNKIKIEVNKKPLNTAGMRVDAQLLEIALKVMDK